ncbi:RNA polymerase sigma factor SigJ [Streptomyces qinzhouensis]|uniref:Sigma-70 family RNA polymerase sigma factor n=1 Tax=Streptomyces qinzhouensis TaxID=2599401 RepID=A0A5B8JAH3_9ACTN|nr:RNA polymerase sigma factor SigJ [Streptomyces qinzhouensis]QDY78346.1 sigma-70 family RNA polymerase sigma factor [Streptomyces qinzhouensis]
MAELSEFENQRRRLWAIAYRITGSVSDAEDAVQETWLRWQKLPDGTADDPGAFLTTVISRICYDQLTSARARRESYIGPWLPEPVVTDSGPEERATLDESVGTALLSVMERLSPPERTALVLHDVFAVPFAEIADVVGRSSDSVRQLASRARRRVRDEAPRRTVDRAEHRRTVDAFLTAVTGGDLEGLLEILDPEVVWRSDGGGKAFAARVPVVGREKVAHFIGKVVRGLVPGRSWLAVHDVNGAPGLVAADPVAGWVAVYSFTVHEGRIVRVDCTLNPDKLAHLDFTALRGEHPEAATGQG